MKKNLAKLKMGVSYASYCLASAAFIYWGWSVLAPHLNAPIFTFWEILGIRMGFASFARIFSKKSD